MNSKRILSTLIIASIGALIGVFTYSKFLSPQPISAAPTNQKIEAQFASYNNNQPQTGYADLTFAAEKSIHAVVHVTVKSTSANQPTGNSLYDLFFSQPGFNTNPQPQVGFGSGVILSENGYIITNNHVIDNADEIEVILNDRRSYTAKLIGTDPTTDIALLKIDEKDLHFLTFGNSDALKIGEWVLAVGNPFNLNSTVTAGIVSAKSRSINILSNPSQSLGIESFIQTDAAVNPGNSGGALVNINGELVGINTAIASQTGSYSGYSFAVPASIARKVVEDLKEFGVVQRALLGVNIRDIDKALAKEKGIDKIEGVYVINVGENSGAKEAGMEAEDIILSVNNETVNSVPELQEKISRHRPGDKVNVLINRDGKQKLLVITLRNTDGSTAIIKAGDSNTILGAKYIELNADEKNRMQIKNGIKVTNLTSGKLKESGVQVGYIITMANDKPIVSVDDFKNIISKEKGRLILTGIYPNGRIVYYAINLAD